ncbi:MAG: DEAD/DEAH box helicase, partial [Patescibacteria group bacterium]
IEFIGKEIASIEEAALVPHKKTFPKVASLRLEAGDYVVHEDHGIGIFREVREHAKEKYFILEYAPARKGGEPDRLLVPEKFAKKISPYAGLSDPAIHRLGSPLWGKTKRKAREDIIAFAKELLALYQARAKVTRPPYLPDEAEKALAESFLHQETPSQQRAREDIFRDFEKPEPMERLVLGDVGFGKTEVALRAAFRAIVNGKQVAVLAPTTVLAEQHLETFGARLSPLGVQVARLSRLDNREATRKTLKEAREGTADILLGTHRLLSKDIEFKNLGLLIIDEEQRFGVKHKETLKKRYPRADILYLSATPIPRTLAFSFSKIRPMSIINDPPLGKQAVETFVLPTSKKIIQDAIAYELERGGQVYFLSPRITKMPFLRNQLEKLFPKIAKALLHGRMPEEQIIRTMHDFREGKVRILISTTIIENGLDISRANTLIVDDATKLGLAEAHQLRGRIGRGTEKAHAYFLYSSKYLTPKAKERLEALLDFQELGAGFEIAKRDLEMRGAGNILGREQSGVMNRIGWNLYFQYLSESLEEIVE